MKLSQILPTAVYLSGVSAGTSRLLHENAVDLSNGADLGVDIQLPVADSTLTLGENETTWDLYVKGKAHIGKGAPDVAYIYIIDSSDSTFAADGDCGSTLDCVQAFFKELNSQVTSDGSAKHVAVIDFDDQAHVTADFQDPSSPLILNAIQQGYPGGGTACSHALEVATLLAHQSTAETVVVVFAGDGQCNGGDESALVLGENVTESADLLGKTGAIVHSIAVGDEVDCDVGNDLQQIPRNGGKCFSIPEPTALPGLIDDIIGTNFTGLEFKVDDQDYRSLLFSETGGVLLPQEGAISVDFQTSAKGLIPGSHEICVRATGEDSVGGVSQVVDCHKIFIEPAPTAAPTSSPTQEMMEAEPLMDDEGNPSLMAGWKIFLIVAGCAAALAIVIHQIGRRSSAKDADNGAAEESAAVPVAVDHGVPLDTPNVV